MFRIFCTPDGGKQARAGRLRLKSINVFPTTHPNFLSRFHSSFSLQNARANSPSHRLVFRDAVSLGLRLWEQHTAPEASALSAPRFCAGGQGGGVRWQRSAPLETEAIVEGTDLAGPAPRFVNTRRSRFMLLGRHFERPPFHAPRKSKTLCQVPCGWCSCLPPRPFFKPWGFRAVPTSPEYSTNAVKNARQSGKTIPISSFC